MESRFAMTTGNPFPTRSSFLVFAEKGLQEPYLQKYLFHELNTTNSIPLKEPCNK